MGGNGAVNTWREAVEIARAFAEKNELNEAKAEAYAETWFEAGKDHDKDSADDLRAYLAGRFNLT